MFYSQVRNKKDQVEGVLSIEETKTKIPHQTNDEGSLGTKS